MVRRPPPSRRVDLFTWRNAVASKDGPSNPQVRFMLLTLSLHMDKEGVCWPSQKLLAERAGVDERTVRRRLKTADESGWLMRKACRRAEGQNWKYHTYQAVVPEEIYRNLPSRPWGGKPDGKDSQGMDERSASRPEGRKVRTEIPQGPDTGEPGTGQNQQKDRAQRPLNSSSNSSYNSKKEGALKRTPLKGLSEEEKARRQAEIRTFVTNPTRLHEYPSLSLMVRIVPEGWRYDGFEQFVEEVLRETKSEAA